MNDSEFITLRQYVETMMQQYEKHHAREHELLTVAQEHAREGLETRLEGMNEFRAQIGQERKTMLTVDKFEVLHQALEIRVLALEKALANLSGRMAAAAAAVSVGLIVFELVLRFVIKP